MPDKEKELKFRAKASLSREWWVGTQGNVFGLHEDSLSVFFHNIESGSLIPATLAQWTGYQDGDKKDIYDKMSWKCGNLTGTITKLNGNWICHTGKPNQYPHLHVMCHNIIVYDEEDEYAMALELVIKKMTDIYARRSETAIEGFHSMLKEIPELAIVIDNKIIKPR